MTGITVASHRPHRLRSTTKPRAQLSHKATPYGLLAPALIVLGVLFIVPAGYNVVLSFQNASPYSTGTATQWVGLQNYRDALASGMGPAFVNTALWLTLFTVVIRLILGMGLALMLQSQVLQRWHLRGVARTMVLVPWMVPPTVAVAAWKWIFDPQYGVINQVLISLGLTKTGIPFLVNTSTVWPAIGTMVIWRELPFVAIVFVAGLQAVSPEQYEAAAMDGAGAARTLWNITLPNMRPVIAVATVMTTMATFNNYVYVWSATQGGPGTKTQVLATQLYSAAFMNNKLGVGAAIGMLMMGCMVVFGGLYLLVTKRRSA